MRCEIVAIGTELLLGQIVDTNSSWIGEQLALVGIDSHFQTKVGDNFERMERTIRHALERSDAVICCGGLGPTQDDITREVIAAIMGVELRRDEAVVEKIRAMFESRGRVMVDNNRRQADIPVGASLIPQMPGTAPGLVCPVGDKVIYAVPGVPHEMRTMMQGTILADLQRRSGETAVIRSRVLRTWGDSESGLAERLADRIDQLDGIGNPTLAFQASGMEGIKVRITAKAPDEDVAAAIISAEEETLRGLLGDIIFGIDEETMESVVLGMLGARGMTLAVAEGLTGGVLSARLSEIDHGMTVFRGGAVSPELNGAGQSGADSADSAARAADHIRGEFTADVGLAVAAAQTREEQSSGTVYMHLAIGEGQYAGTVALPGDRNRFRNYAVINVLNFLRKTLTGT